jgi:hypothetical protein
VIKINRDKVLTALIMSSFISGCTGGGGGSGGRTSSPTTTPPPATPTPIPIVYNTAEFQENSALAQMNAQSAYLNAISGEGVLVAVIDSGVTEVPEMAGQLHAASTNVATGNDADTDDYSGHGTAMAGIIAARKDTNNDASNMHGIAYNAQILNINTTDATDCPDLDNCTFSHSNIAKAYDYAVAQGVDVINESLGSDTANTNTLALAIERAVNAGILIVVPAGNIDDDTPIGVSDSAQLSTSNAYANWANGQIIIAGSVDENNVISDFSYKAGADAQDVYLVAPGGNITSPDHDTTNNFSYVLITGTSASTAFISGAAALLTEAFPNLTAAQTADLLFTTATDLGDPGTDIIYGRGLVNLKEAFTAQGQLTVAGFGFAAGKEIGTDESIQAQNLLLSGGAFGSDISFSDAFSNVSVLDQYQRSYNVDLSQGIYLPKAGLSLENFIGAGLDSRYHSIQLNDRANLKMGWRVNSRFSEIDRRYFSNHLGRDKRAGNLRMSLSYNLGGGQIAKTSAGMSIAEMMEDYRPDDFMAPNKHGFSSLLSSQGTQAFSYKTPFSTKSSFQSLFANSKINIDEQLFSQRIEVKNTLLLNRFNHSLNNNTHLAFDIGLLEENGSVLGSISRGALEFGEGASTGFIGTKLDILLSEKSHFFARATYGITSVDQSTASLLGNMSTLKSYSYLAGFKRNALIFDDDQISFTFSQPLKLAGGTATISNVLNRNYQTNSFTMAYNTISLSPDGTERDFELAYSIGNFYGARVQLNLLHQLNPGHSKNMDNATSVLIRLGSAF